MKNKSLILVLSVMVVAGVAVFFGVNQKDTFRTPASRQNQGAESDQEKSAAQGPLGGATASSENLSASKEKVAAKLKADPNFNQYPEFMKKFMLDHLDEVLALQKANEDESLKGYAKIENEFWTKLEARQNQKMKDFIDGMTPEQKEEFNQSMKKKENIEGFVKEQSRLQFKPEEMEIDADLFPSR